MSQMKKLVLSVTLLTVMPWLSLPLYAQGGDWEKIGLQTKRTYCEPGWSIGTTKCPKQNEATAALGSQEEALTHTQNLQ